MKIDQCFLLCHSSVLCAKTWGFTNLNTIFQKKTNYWVVEVELSIFIHIQCKFSFQKYIIKIFLQWRKIVTHQGPKMSLKPTSPKIVHNGFKIFMKLHVEINVFKTTKPKQSKQSVQNTYEVKLWKLFGILCLDLTDICMIYK